jgi:hypothetical protein
MLTSASLAAWLDDRDWHLYRESGEAITADRAARPGARYVLVLRADLDDTWQATALYRQTLGDGQATTLGHLARIRHLTDFGQWLDLVLVPPR